jgi:hypothetical protein
MSQGTSPLAVTVPELGPSLGRLTVPSAPGGDHPWWLDLEAVRYQLVTEVFELAGQARAAGDVTRALAALDPEHWLAAWDRAVKASAQGLVHGIDLRLLAAAREARMPRGRRRRTAVTQTESRAIAVRLGATGGPFLAELEALKQARQALIGAKDPVPELLESWEEALGTVARRLEAAWLALEQTLRREQEAWSGEIERVRGWRRPSWPLWVTAVVILGVASYLGLVVGGYLPAPAWLEPLVAAWWNLF